MKRLRQFADWLGVPRFEKPKPVVSYVQPKMPPVWKFLIADYVKNFPDEQLVYIYSNKPSGRRTYRLLVTPKSDGMWFRWSIQGESYKRRWDYGLVPAEKSICQPSWIDVPDYLHPPALDIERHSYIPSDKTAEYYWIIPEDKHVKMGLKSYRSKTQYIRAIQYDGTDESADAIIAEFAPSIQFGGNREDFYVKKFTGVSTILVGDWFIRDSDGCAGHYTDSYFNEMFEEVSHGEVSSKD